MKKILGLDLGTTSIGWALVEEAENENEESSIIKLGVRVNPLSVDEKTDFEKGRPLSTNASRTQKRGARRNLQRYKLRRKNLIEILQKNGIIDDQTPLTENGKNTTHKTFAIRARAAKQEIKLDDLALVFLAINKKRGYKSSRKAVNEDDGVAIDGMQVAKHLYENGLTPGQYALSLLQQNKKYIPDFYRSDLKEEFTKIWEHQAIYYPKELTVSLFDEVIGKSKKATWAICQNFFNVQGIKRSGKKAEQRIENYQWRTKAVEERIDLEQLIIVLQEINNEINGSSGYLGAISDRSKELFFKNQTVGQYLYSQLKKNPHASLKNQVFYRQDYLDEFEKIWETQAAFHDILQPELKKEIRDIIIFYQRKLKSQKGQLALCQLESWEQKHINKETKKEHTRTIGRKVIPKSSPLFQHFKIWQNLNNLEYTNEELNQKIIVKELDDEIRKVLFEELNLRGKLSKSEVLKLIGKHMKLGKVSLWSCNFDEIEGNRTNQKILDVLQSITAMEGYAIDWKKQPASKIIEELNFTLPQIGIDPAILFFDPYAERWSDQASYRLWHLLYSTEEDDKISNEDRELYGINAVAIKKALHLHYNFSPTYARMMAGVMFPKDYGNLSAKAIRKILPFLEDGQNYADACRAAGYNHSNSLTKEELSKRILKDKLELLPKNSLRNPVVEKILNQMVNVVNQVIETYGKPDEIRIELARELKKSATERATMTKGIADATKRNDDIRKYITKTFGIPNPTKNDIIRYRLYQELESNGHKDIFTNTYISKDILFSKSIDIEHILPKALVYDDSFSNKTLAFRKDNLKKKDRTAIDFIANDYAAELNNYKSRVEQLYKEDSISKAKQIKLLRPANEIPDGFIERDLRNSQYIARKAKSLLFEVFKEVTTTTGNITDRLRSDWGIINVVKELNLPKYRSAGLTTFEERLDIGEGKIKKYEVIKDWSKRNDHRHHAMDALTVAFTTHNHIQYINNYNARRDTSLDHHPIIKNIEKLITEKKEKGKSGNNNRVFIAPMSSFREKAKKQLEEVLISFKNKNKVVTWNVNTIKAPDGKKHYKRQQTPRGKLHKETVYGKSKRPLEKKIKLKKNFGLDQVQLIVDPKIRAVVNHHLTRYDNNPEIAFSTSTLKKDPLIYLNETINEVHCFEDIFTIRKDINPDNFKTEKLINKVVDLKIRAILKERFKEYGENPKVAFSDLESNPIYLNKEKGIVIKRVSMIGVSNAEALHTAKDHLGNEIKDEIGKVIPVDYVSTGNNHHVAIYEDEKGNLQEEVVSFFEAVTRKNNGFSVVQKNHAKGWKFLFTMKQNEMFIIPSEDFDPNKYDLLDPANYTAISKRLFRVQKIASKNYMFRHHLETELINAKELRGASWELFQSLSYLKDLVKVRINHIGQVVQIGEY